MLNHTRGISSWERARSRAAPLTRHGSHSLLQVIPRTLEPFMELVNPSCTIIYHCGDTKLGQRAPHPHPTAGPMEQPMAHDVSPGRVTSGSSWTCPATGGATSDGPQLKPRLHSEGTASAAEPRALCAALSIPAEPEPRGSPWRWPRSATRAGGSAAPAPCERGCCHRQAEREH